MISIFHLQFNTTFCIVDTAFLLSAQGIDIGSDELENVFESALYRLT